VELTLPRADRAVGRAAARSIAIGGTVAGLVPLLLRASFPWHFHTNDDAQMFAISSGHDGGSASAALVWQHPAIGELLVQLGTRFPGIAWYGWWLHGLLTLATAVAIASVLHLLRAHPPQIALVAVLPIVMSTAVFTVSLQFTVVALTLGFAAVLSWSAIAFQGSRGRWYLVPSILLLLAGMTRLSSALAALAFGALLALGAALQRRRSVTLRTLVGSALTVLVILAVSLAPALGDRAAGGGGTGYDLRMRFAPGPDFPVLGERQEQILRQVGWTRNDYELFNSWFRADHDVFTENLSAFYGLAWAAGPSPTLGGVLAGLPRIVTGHPLLWLLVASVLLQTARTSRSAPPGPSRSGPIVVVAFAAASLLLLALVQGVSRLPLWVGLPLVAFIVTGSLLLALLPTQGRTGGTRATAAIVAIVAALVVVATVLQIQSLAEEREGRAARSIARLAELERLDTDLGGDTVVLTWLLDTWTHLDPLAWPPQREVTVIPIEGWNYPTEYRRAQFVALGLADPYPAVADDPNVLIVAREDRIELLRVFLAEHRGLACRVPRVLGTLSDGVSLVVDRFVQAPCASLDWRG
jgi:hypothetical protein